MFAMDERKKETICVDSHSDLDKCIRSFWAFVSCHPIRLLIEIARCSANVIELQNIMCATLNRTKHVYVSYVM